MDYTIIDAHAHLWLRQDTVVDDLPICTLDIDYQMYELKKESIVLLCTDGLSNYLEIEKLPELLKNCIRKESLADLIDFANDQGGSDNITAVMLYRK